MNNKIKFLPSILLGVVLACLAALALEDVNQPAEATGQVYPSAAPNFYRLDTNAISALTLTNGANVTFPPDGTNSLEISIRQDHGLSVFVQVISTNALSVAETLHWDTSFDGNITNGTTTGPIAFTVPANFVGTNEYWTNFPASYLNNISTIQLTSCTNAAVGGGNTNTVRIGRLAYSYSGQ